MVAKEGDQVQRGDLMAIINSRELADAKSTFLAAVQRVQFARVALEREENLWKKKISAEAALVGEPTNMRRGLVDQQDRLVGHGVLPGLWVGGYGPAVPAVQRA